MPNPSQAPDDTPESPAKQHYFDASPDVASDRRVLELSLPDIHLRLTADRGVFAAEQIDTGTKYLLLEAPLPPPGNLTMLDVGCGYGPIALTLAKRAPTSTVWAVDVNERALALCEFNAKEAGVNNVTVALPDAVPPELLFDRIYANPPIRIGKTALHDLLTTWLNRLAPGGIAYLVVQKHLGADSLTSWLSQQGWPAQKLSSRKAFRILEVRANPESETNR